MKLIQTICLGSFLAVMAAGCAKSNDEMLAPDAPVAEAGLTQPSALNKECSYVDGNWSGSAYLNSTIINSTQTNFIYGQLTKVVNLWGQSTLTLRIVHDDANPNSTYNAISYSYPRKIYFGEAIYRAALAKGQIVPAMILAHEFGHQLQYSYNLPSVTENTARPNELEADGFAGYYMRSPNGYNATWAAAGPGFEFAYAIGDYSTTSAGHHGTPPQRRSATRLGWYLGAYNLTASAFDYNFFYYYSNVLSGSYRVARDPQYTNPELEAFMNSKIEELRKINEGVITGEEFKNLPTE